MTDRRDPDDDPLPAAGYRTYEVYQRERVAESSNLLAPRELIGDEMLTAPDRLLTILREHHPCYRDWVGNRFWITRYDDVTSVFTDDANYETRSKRWFAGRANFGRDLRSEVPVQWARANRIDAHVETIVERMLADLGGPAGGAGVGAPAGAGVPADRDRVARPGHRLRGAAPAGAVGCRARSATRRPPRIRCPVLAVAARLPGGNRGHGEMAWPPRTNWRGTSSRSSPSGGPTPVTI